MSDRFSDLSPISSVEYERIGRLALDFFNPLNSKEYRKILEMPYEGRIVPFSSFDFYSYLNKCVDRNFEKKLYKVKRILSLMEHAGFLTNEGHSNRALLGTYYYAIKELTELQQRNSLWLGEAFGLSYLQEKLKNNVIHITGQDKFQRIGNGTGFLINNKTVLTCKHVITDMSPDKKIRILEEEYTYKTKASSEQDVALLILDKEVVDIDGFPPIRDARILDEVIIMGYPPIPGTVNDCLLSQKGEVNATVYNYLTQTNGLILSSVTRPGNSGGPVISKDGYLIGMVTAFNVAGEQISTSISKEEKIDRFPFYTAIQGKSIFEAIQNIDPNIEIYFEDYQ